MTVDEKLKILGDNFRGLWRSKLVKEEGIIEEGWSVTFLYNGDLVETDYFETPEEALNKTIKILELNQEKN